MEIHNASNTQHLTDEQFADLLLGATPSSVQEHLKACAECSQEAERVANAIGSFERQSRVWAERRAATRPMLVPARRPEFVWLGLPQAWAAAALAIAVVAGVGLSVRNERERAAQQTVAAVEQSASSRQAANPVQRPIAPGYTTATAVTRAASATGSPSAAVPQATLKADNELLSAIDGELRTEDSASAGMYGLDVNARGARPHVARGIVD